MIGYVKNGKFVGEDEQGREVLGKKRDWSKVADEQCTCTHPKSHHNGPIHHGDCQQCKCPRYTWMAFLDKDGKKV